MLPGLPTWIDDDYWLAIGAAFAQPASPSHPLYAMKHLIEEIGIDRADIVTLSGARDKQTRVRQKTIVEVFRPADLTDRWRAVLNHSASPAELSTVDLVEAPGDHEEATAIALLMREFREHKTGQAALITPDRRLARRAGDRTQRSAVPRWGPLPGSRSDGAPSYRPACRP